MPQRQSIADPAIALAEPRRRLHRAGIRVRRSVHIAPEGVRPEVWRTIAPLYIIAETLIEHGFIEVKRGTGLDPVRWRFKTVGLPSHVRNAVRDVYRWALRENVASGTIWLREAARWFEQEHIDDILAFRDEGQTERVLPVLQDIIQQRNNFAKLAAGTQRDSEGRPTSVNGISVWPASPISFLRSTRASTALPTSCASK
jgi:hypothetical protein